MLGDLSGLLGSIPCYKCLFSTAEQQEDAPMMSKKSTNDRVVPNCRHTPLQRLSGWEVEGKKKAFAQEDALISETRLLFSSPCEPQPLRRSRNRLLLRGNSSRLSASPILAPQKNDRQERKRTGKRIKNTFYKYGVLILVWWAENNGLKQN